MNKMKKQIVPVLIMTVLTISLAGCGKKDETEVLNQKIVSEIEYLDVTLINMLNNTIGISFENYIVKAEQVNGNSAATSSKGTGTSSEGSEISSTSSKEGTGKTGGGGQAGGNEEDNQNSTHNMNYQMVGNEILLQGKTTDWQMLKADVEKLYSAWSIITLDLYKLNVNSQNILNFNTDLDATTQAIKNEDKIKTLNSIVKLYSYIPIYSKEISKNEQTTNVYNTKSNILSACVQIEQENLQEVKKELTNAEQSFLPIINNMSSQNNNEVNINKAYILIKDLQQSTDKIDKDIFYIKYKNLIQELNIL